MRKLDEIALTIELVLISIIEGVALASLGGASIPIFRDEFTLTSLSFVAAGLVLLLVFWSQAILHAISFIRWPLKMEHMLMYFLAAFLQVVAYNNLTDPVMWFFWWTLFSLLVLGVYAVDLRVIKETVPSFEQVPNGSSYIHEVLRRHVYEFKHLVPLSVAFNLIALGLVYFLNSSPLLCLGLGILQLLISFGVLLGCVRNFKERSAILPALFE